MRRKANAQKGSVLLTVVVVSMMMMIIISACISLVGHTMTRTNTEYRQKQAYYIASSSLEAFVKAVSVDAADGTLTAEQSRANKTMWRDIAGSSNAADRKVDVKILLNNNPIDVPRMSENMYTCTLEIQPVTAGDTNNMKAICTATYLGEPKTVVAYFKVDDLGKAKYLNNALEIIGTEGGSTKMFDNVEVLGNTTASLVASHKANTIYEPGSINDQGYYGDITILGSLAPKKKMNFFSSQYYSAEARNNVEAQGLDYMEGPGCSVNVSRSFYICGNPAVFATTNVKNPDYTGPGEGEEYYNYINVGEALAFQPAQDGVSYGYLPGQTTLTSQGTSVSAAEGNSNTYRLIDMYCNCFAVGKLSGDSTFFGTLNSSLVNSFKTEGVTDAQAQAKYNQFVSGEDGDNNGIIVNGNIYVFDEWTQAATGNVYIKALNGVKVNGDMYVKGNIYINNGDARFKGTKINGNLYLSSDSKIYLSTNGTSGSEVTPTQVSGTNEYTIASNEWFNVTGNVEYGDWEEGDTRSRSTKPPINCEESTTIPYYYYPEHLMLLKGSGQFNSSIADQYVSFYEDTKTFNNKGEEVFDSEGNPKPDGLYNELKDHTKVKYLSDCTNTSSYTYTLKQDKSTYSSSSVTLTPLYYIDDSCVFDSLSPQGGDANAALGRVVLIDVDAADKDLVIILKDGCQFDVNQGVQILIRNTKTDSNGNLEHFVYFVSDSGAGYCGSDTGAYNSVKADLTVHDEYSESKAISTYERDTLRHYYTTDSTGAYTVYHGPSYTFYVQNGNMNSIMDFDAFAWARVMSPTKTIDINADYENTDSDFYDAGESGTFFLLAEGSQLIESNTDLMVQASIYGPRADVHWRMGIKSGVALPIKPNFQMNSTAQAVIGSVICHAWYPANAARNGIAFQAPARNSMLPQTRGADSIDDNAFRLYKYDNH